MIAFLSIVRAWFLIIAFPCHAVSGEGGTPLVGVTDEGFNPHPTPPLS